MRVFRKKTVILCQPDELYEETNSSSKPRHDPLLTQRYRQRVKDKEDDATVRPSSTKRDLIDDDPIWHCGFRPENVFNMNGLTTLKAFQACQIGFMIMCSIIINYVKRMVSSLIKIPETLASPSQLKSKFKGSSLLTRLRKGPFI